MRPPSTYAEWVQALEELRKADNDEVVLAALESGHLEWSSGVAERATALLLEVTDARLKQNSELLQRDLGRSSRSVDTLIASLLAARRRYTVILRLARVPAFPEYVRGHITESVRASAEASQKSLEQSALDDRTGTLSRAIRNNPVDPSRAPAAATAPAPPIQTGLGEPRPTRRVILP